jgi:hypothetical protein
MKITITFEYADLLEDIEKKLAMSGVRPTVNDKGEKQITFNHKKKEVVAHCEAAPIPDSCLFCGGGVDQEAQTKQDDPSTQANEDEPKPTEPTNKDDDDSQANEGEQEDGGTPMSLAQLKAHSSALSRQDGPIKHNVQRGAEAHAALAGPTLMEGESSDPPFGGDGDE